MQSIHILIRTGTGVLIVLVVALAHTLFRCDFTIINRYGTVVVVVGILLDYWPVLRTVNVDDMAFWGTQEGHDSMRIAILVVCVGTLVQGYGDWGLIYLFSTRCPQ